MAPCPGSGLRPTSRKTRSSSNLSLALTLWRLARSRDTSTLLALADLIAGVREELGLHASYAASWGIDMAGVQPLAATSAYTEFLLATAATQDVGVIYAAMTPCMRLYAWLGQSLDADRAGPYAQWVQTYADPEFEGIARVLEGLLDDQADDTPAVRRAYRRAMFLELAFFEAAVSA